MRKQFDRLIGPLRRRVLLMIGRAVVHYVDDSLKLQALQIQALPGEVLDGVERFQQYGFTSVPHAGAEAILAALGGQRQHSVVLAVEDRRYRITGLADGEVCIYTDEDEEAASGSMAMPHRIILGRGRMIRLEAAGVSMVMDGDAGTAVLTAGSSVIEMDDQGISLTAGSGATAVLTSDVDIDGGRIDLTAGSSVIGMDDQEISLTAGSGATAVLTSDVDIDGGRIDLN